MVEQFVAHLRAPAAFLAEAEPAAWLWEQLRALTPFALAAVLMPTHFHLLVPEGRLAPDRLERLLVGFARRFGVRDCWIELPEPRRYPTPDKVRRQIRYIHLNPCRPSKIGHARVKLVADPLAWEWSTHRDLVGAVVDPWVTPATLAEYQDGDAARWHRYVSSDGEVAVGGTPFPVAAPQRPTMLAPLGRIIQAAAAATRGGESDIRRRGVARNAFLDLAVHQGWRGCTQLASLVHTDREAVRRRRARPDPQLVGPAALCLGDDRLLVRTSWTPPASLGALGLGAWRS